MPTIDANEQVVTLVNRFEVAPEQRARLLEILDEATDNVMRHRPGFVSASIHVSLDGRYVMNYAQWRSEEEFRDALAHPDAQPHFSACRAIAKVDPCLYRVISTAE
jgi:quinol monooxygenase YgiN